MSRRQQKRIERQRREAAKRAARNGSMDHHVNQHPQRPMGNPEPIQPRINLDDPRAFAGAVIGQVMGHCFTVTRHKRRWTSKGHTYEFTEETGPDGFPIISVYRLLNETDRIRTSMTVSFDTQGRVTAGPELFRRASREIETVAEVDQGRHPGLKTKQHDFNEKFMNQGTLILTDDTTRALKQCIQVGFAATVALTQDPEHKACKDITELARTFEQLLKVRIFPADIDKS